jgi:hypothetical protein
MVDFLSIDDTVLQRLGDSTDGRIGDRAVIGFCCMNGREDDAEVDGVCRRS